MQTALLAFLRPSLGEIIVIAIVAILFIGSKRLPDAGRALGQAIRNFHRSFRGDPSGPPSEGE